MVSEARCTALCVITLAPIRTVDRPAATEDANAAFTSSSNFPTSALSGPPAPHPAGSTSPNWPSAPGRV